MAEVKVWHHELQRAIQVTSFPVNVGLVAYCANDSLMRFCTRMHGKCLTSSLAQHICCGGRTAQVAHV